MRTYDRESLQAIIDGGYSLVSSNASIRDPKSEATPVPVELRFQFNPLGRVHPEVRSTIVPLPDDRISYETVLDNARDYAEFMDELRTMDDKGKISRSPTIEKANEARRNATEGSNG